MKKYYSLVANGDTVEIVIYGDITSWEWTESDVSSYTLSKELEGIDASKINVYINSYGGETAEGLAIYNALKRQTAEITTYCDGFACSAASIVFMAGNIRIMGDASLLMIHNAWTTAQGNANELRKVADDLDTISAAAAQAYQSVVSIDIDTLQSLLDNETWISPEEAVMMGFATQIAKETAPTKVSASARKIVSRALLREKRTELAITINAENVEEIVNAKLAPILAQLEARKSPLLPQNNLIKFITALGGKEI